MCDRGTSSGCFFTSKKGRETAPDIATSPRRQNPPHGTNNTSLRPKEPPFMVVQGDFRKVSGISNEIFRQIETIENEYDASTAAALEAVERRGEMIVRILDTKNLGKAAAEAAKKFLNLQDSKHTVLLVEIIKRPGQTLGLYIREGNGLDRQDGVFISRIALESAVYNSGCIQVGDEILAVNLVDVTRMSIDDVVIIMSIPRRLVLATRQVKGYPSTGTLGSASYAGTLHARPPEPKPPPVVVIKKDLYKEDEYDDDDDEKHLLHSRFENRNDMKREAHGREKSRSQYALDSNGDLGTDLYYNSRPAEPRHHQTATLDRRLGGWSYAPQHSILDHHLKPVENLQSDYDRSYPKTLESLAEKVHPFCPGGSTLGRRTSETALSTRYSQSGNRRLQGMVRSGSDQHLPRTEYDDFSRTLPTRQSHTLLRSNFRTGATTPSYARQYSAGGAISSYGSTLSKRHNVDYASDTEASYPTISKSSYYYCRSNPTQAISGISSSTLSRLTKSGALSRASSLRSNSLPRDTRMTRNQLPSLPPSSTLSNALMPNLKYGGAGGKIANNLLDQEDDGTLSAPELPSSEKFKKRMLPTTNVFTADEYRAWLSRTPSTSAIYDRLKSNRDSSLLRQKGRFTFSAENLPERTRQSELLSYSKYRPNQLASMGPVSMTPLPSATISTLDRHTRTSSLRRMRHLQELEAKHLGNRATTPDVQVDRTRVLEINTSEFTKYKMEKSHLSDEYSPVSGLLWIHLLAGRGLRVTATASPLTGHGPNTATRDLYCVLECDRIHKARTVVRNGDLVFDWDETFELDLFSNRELDFLVYSWDPQYRHKLCYKGSVHLSSLLYKSPIHQLALKVEPRGTLYIRLRHTNAYHTYLRKQIRPLLSSRSVLTISNLFGTDLETVVNRESGSISVSLQSLPQPPLAASVPIIIRRCVEEIERRGLDIIGLYRLCGSATKKRILREAFERNPRTIDLSPDNVPDINVITGVFKDYLRELPEPLFTKHLYQMIVDALSVCMSDDPQGNAKLIFSLLDCLSRINRATLIFVMDHLSLVVSQSATNKMSAQNLSIIFAPLLMIRSETEEKEIDFNQPINILRYLLEVWPSKSVREIIIGPGKISAAPTGPPPPLPKKPSVVSGHVGGPLPIPSKGIRKPPPAVPARSIQVAVASPITENSSSTSSSDGAGTEVETVVNMPVLGAAKNDSLGKSPDEDKPPQVPLRSSSYQTRSSIDDFVSTPDDMDEFNGDKTESATNALPSNRTNSSSSSGSGKISKYLKNGHSQKPKTSSNTSLDSLHSDPSGSYSIQSITTSQFKTSSDTGTSNAKPDTARIEEALKQINTTKPVAANFGHSRVDSTNSVAEKVSKPDTSPWDSIVESWIKETEDSSEIMTSAISESFKRSHKNPFLADLNSEHSGSTDSTRYKTFSNSFSFCVDSPSTSVSNGSTTDSTTDSASTVVENETSSKLETNPTENSFYDYTNELTNNSVDNKNGKDDGNFDRSIEKNQQ
ncbi:rho GTPase-activating protein 100F isoform X2 [Planococcus citri]|uniref:rho GTPase-activating protein 100F isoform X2 n=1 Tax=Planococcus citri TaxID=170843 RepID=UPI0031F84DDF